MAVHWTFCQRRRHDRALKTPAVLSIAALLTVGFNVGQSLIASRLF